MSTAVEGVEKKPVPDKSRVYTQLLESLIGLQVAVNSMVDNGKNPMVVKGGKEPPAGVKQLLEKKDGLFRKNMMVSPLVFSQFRLTKAKTTNRENESTTLLDQLFRPM